MKSILNLKIFIIVLSLTLFIAANETLNGKVIAVSDGDTFTLLQGKEQIKVRLNRVDCPEKSQAFGQKAKQFTSDMIFGKTVSVISSGKDRYGRVIGEVMLENGKSLNAELVRNGFAWWYRQYAPKDTELENLEASARIGRLGLWADPSPVEPWNYRKGNKSSEETTGKNINTIQPSGGDSVYFNMKSEKYHCRSCKYVNGCTNCVLVPVARAEKEGVPCKVCGGCVVNYKNMEPPN